MYVCVCVCVCVCDVYGFVLDLCHVVQCCIVECTCTWKSAELCVCVITAQYVCTCLFLCTCTVYVCMYVCMQIVYILFISLHDFKSCSHVCVRMTEELAQVHVVPW